MKILLTGFEPFGGEPVNPSLEAVHALTPPAGVALVTSILPTRYATTLRALREVIAANRPDAVISVGQAGGRAEMSVERVAINVDDARIGDNDGVRRIDEPVIPDGPAAYFSTLPIKAMVAAIRAAGVPASVSQSAGTFLCNHAFYGACHLAATAYPGMRVGFIHVPYLPEQTARHPGTASMALATMIAGLLVAIDTVSSLATDIRVAEGTTH